jgi:hypothetical protein
LANELSRSKRWRSSFAYHKRGQAMPRQIRGVEEECIERSE